MNPHLLITLYSVAQSFCNFAQSTAVMLPCSVQNFSTIRKLKRILWTNEDSRDLGVRWISHSPSRNKACSMMTSSNGNFFRDTGPLWGESTGHRWFPSQRPVTRSFDIPLIWASANGWANNRNSGDLRHHRDHKDVTVMETHLKPKFRESSFAHNIFTQSQPFCPKHGGDTAVLCAKFQND